MRRPRVRVTVPDRFVLQIPRLSIEHGAYGTRAIVEGCDPLKPAHRLRVLFVHFLPRRIARGYHRSSHQRFSLLPREVEKTANAWSAARLVAGYPADELVDRLALHDPFPHFGREPMGRCHGLLPPPIGGRRTLDQQLAGE